MLIRRGGISSIRVVDDGSGMDRDDALLCLERHATSKIRTGEDLASIHTLGFRGEAPAQHRQRLALSPRHPGSRRARRHRGHRQWRQDREREG
ncbi:MAG: hypothetical protein WDN28_17585 [Chthoniobacter sp.]